MFYHPVVPRDNQVYWVRIDAKVNFEHPSLIPHNLHEAMKWISQFEAIVWVNIHNMNQIELQGLWLNQLKKQNKVNSGNLTSESRNNYVFQQLYAIQTKDKFKLTSKFSIIGW